MLRADPSDERLVRNRLTDAIDQYRFHLFILAAIPFLLAFNGQWRVGTDSSHYRGLAHAIVTGQGYTWGQWAGEHILPGFPLMLAGVEWLVGRGDLISGPAVWVTLLVLLGMSAGILVLTYRMVLMHYPRWMAVTVTYGVGISATFIQLTSEILTDIPFLLGVMLTLYGWELIQKAENTVGRHTLAILILLAGLVLAASTRPFAWVLVGALMVTWLVGLVRGPRRLSIIGLSISLGCLLVLLTVDPRTHGFNPTGGGYEREVLQALANGELWGRIGDNLLALLHRELPAAFLGQTFFPFNLLISATLIVGAGFLFRRNPLWALLIWGTLLATLLTSVVPRYYLMIMPLLMLSWLLVAIRVAWLMRSDKGRFVVLGGLLLVVTINNYIGMTGFIVEQRRVPFIQHYDKGKYVPIIQMAELIREHARPDEKVLGPLGAVMRYFSGVHVYNQRELLPHGPAEQYPRMIAEAGLSYVVFPAKWYRSKDPLIARLMERRIIFPAQIVAGDVPEMYLARPIIMIPPTDWQELPRGWRGEGEMIQPWPQQEPCCTPDPAKVQISDLAQGEADILRTSRSSTVEATTPPGR